jgi:hypothetical protein
VLAVSGRVVLVASGLAVCGVAFAVLLPALVDGGGKAVSTTAEFSLVSGSIDRAIHRRIRSIERRPLERIECDAYETAGTPISCSVTRRGGGCAGYDAEHSNGQITVRRSSHVICITAG